MPNPDLYKWLESGQEIDITVTGRKSGKMISLPIWFVKEERNLLLLPVNGSKTNWYRNVQRTPTISIFRGGNKITIKASTSDNQATVRNVVEKFRTKYGAEDVKKYYPRPDVCVQVTLP